MARRYLGMRTAGDLEVGAARPDQPGSPAAGKLDLSGDLLGGRRRILMSPRKISPAKSASRQPRRLVSWISALLILLVAWQWGNAGWILVKAQLAQWLIAQAWDESQRTLAHQPSSVAGAETAPGNQTAQGVTTAIATEILAQDIKPWPWADTHPVARLRMPDEGVDLFVLEGAQGNSLAFGPGHVQGTALPGEGISVIGGHRDTHFRFLKNIKPGDELYLQTRDGRQLTYRIEQRQVVDSRHTPLQLPEYLASGLVLVTCYPFDALDPNGPLRLVVWAREVEDEFTASPSFYPEPSAYPKSSAYPEPSAGTDPLSFAL